ncbi:MAG: dicarboxylate/amino acid:cation symporter, partial [Sediminibacterium sp.]|nr:dicarboxylate/amino acid:cation symporter [Sediminibacterium sp.]
YILIALVLGVIVGFIVNEFTNKDFAQSFGSNIKLLTDIFLRLVKMIIGPLVISTLVVGISKLGEVKTIGRIGLKSILWFLFASLVSLTIGLFWVNFLKPGEGLNLHGIENIANLENNVKTFNLSNFLTHIFPESVVESLARNEILQIVVFSIFLGVAVAAVGEPAKPLVIFLESLAHVILKMVNYVMYFAPLGVFGALASIIATEGFQIFTFYGLYLIDFIIGVICLWIFLIIVGWLVLRTRFIELLKKISTPLLIAFSTSSSEAVFPKLTEILEKFGCKNKIVSFVLPLGYSFNLDGSMLYMTFASLAIAQAFNIPLDFGTQVTMLLVLMISSKGIAGVPRASLVVVMAVCVMFNIPAEGIAIILPIDHFCDMFRSATNVLGNSVATTLVSKWENSIEKPELENI